MHYVQGEKRAISASAEAKKKDTSNLRSSLHNDNGVADMILHEVPSRIDESRHSKQSNDSEPPADDRVKTKATGRHRRSGYEIVKHQSQLLFHYQSSDFECFVNKQVDIILYSAFEVVKTYAILESPT